MPTPDVIREFLLGTPTTPGLSAADVKGVVTGMISPAAPPPVATNGAPGQQDMLPRADHTHATSVQRAVLKSDGKGLVTWVFGRPYQPGQVPTCSATPECTVPASGASPVFFVANLVTGSVTNTQCQFQIVRYSAQSLGATITALLGAVISVFGVPSDPVTVHCTAALPTQ